MVWACRALAPDQAKVMTRSGTNLASGFHGPVRGWGSLVPDARRILQLPRDRAVWAAAAGNGEAPAWDVIEIQAWTESLGRIEDTLARLTRSLAEGGTLLLDVDNLQSPRMLRMVVEGHPGSFDPAGSTDDPSLALPLRRVLAAAGAAGLVVGDVLAVPSIAPEFGPAFAASLLPNGLLPLEWLDGPPPSRFWLTGTRQRTLAGSVLLAGGDAAASARTRACLAGYLPDDWEIVAVDAVGEIAQWNRAVAAARGDVVWFVRAGAEPTAATFESLSAEACVGAVAPGAAGVRRCPGDLSGTMLPRQDVLLVGPIDESFANPGIALEDYLMRLDCKLPGARLVGCEFSTPAPALRTPEAFAGEAELLVQRWSPVTNGTAPTAAAEPVAMAAAARRATPWQGREPRVSLCMIARNEERFLGECLARAKDAVDEIVIVDTGSTDRTVAIAESFGARVLHEPWQDDFSAPRNTAIAAATGDWILVLDADEFVMPGGVEKIRELVRSEVVSGWHLRFTNVYGNGKTVGVMMVRLFRNLPGVRYQNVIHEQVTPSLQRLGTELGLILASAEVEVEHHGYTAEVIDERGKNERNERLFKKQIELTPEDVYAHYKYGDFLRRVPGRGEDARRLLDRCLALILAGPPTLPRELPYAGEVAALCALEAARAGETARAREVVDLALRRFVPTPNLHYLAASIALAEHRSEDAILHYRRCLAYRGQVLVVPIQDGITGHVSLAGIAQAWLLRGETERARRLLEQAIALEPAYEVAQLALSRLWFERGDCQRALRVLTEYLAAHPDSPGACQQTTLILSHLGLKAQARRMGRQAVALLEARALDHEAKAMNDILATI